MKLQSGSLGSLRIPDNWTACLDGCGFGNGVYSGFCSTCWNKKTFEEKQAANAHAPFITTQTDTLVVAKFDELDGFESIMHRIEMVGNYGRKELMHTRAYTEFKESELEKKLNAMWTQQMMEANEELLKIDKVLSSLPVVPFSRSPAWTLVACLQLHWGVCRDVRRLIYNSFVALQYGSFAKASVKRIVEENGKWFTSLPRYETTEKYASDCWYNRSSPRLNCVDVLCKSFAPLQTGALRSKLRFESWLSKHFFESHCCIRWETFVSLSETCLHEKVVEKCRNEHLVVDTVTMRTRICTRCGKILSEDMEI
jgi:hypothetical protein